ncbi:hypothetical protein N476_07045 [Pseudoalteromonas luteoviolacea H33]|uniref:DUF2141 domain-containing protein n=2 Tax=Pseudoalteromonas luteoviolacea TaxID=43657 RepID=A0A161YB45_9GAMM|nr:hypothetical protein N476_07045 [Pseudoalteromonas luteoviolacea H33]KZN74504.1 hypothetical protein N477_22255 [Pseudoalteromonas luteoviolacea H33-S]
MTMCKLYKSIIFGVLMITTEAAIATSVQVKINGIDTRRPGQIMVMLFEDNGFPVKHKQALQTQFHSPESKSLTVEFTTAKAEIAIKVLHDEDNSQTTSKNWTGLIPSEGLGFSNGAKISWRGPPKFKDAKLSLADINTPISISIKYP